MKQAVVLLAHGSRDRAARAEYSRLADLVAAGLSEAPVHFAVLEFPGDGLASIPEAVASCVRDGAQRVVALPYFLFAAGHVREDLPGELRSAAGETPELRIAYQPPLGVDARILDILEDRAQEAFGQLGAQSRESSAVLLVGAGTSDPASNADLSRAARLLWERRRFKLVEVAFVSLTEPSVLEGIRRCHALGASSVAVVPYFLNTGVLSRRIENHLDEARRQWGDLPLVLGAEMGLHPSMIELLWERARLGLRSAETENYDLPPCATEGPWRCGLSR